MSNNTEYTETGSITGTETGIETATETGAESAKASKPKSSGTKVVVVGMVVGLVALVGFFTFRILTKPAPAPRPAVTATQNEPAAALPPATEAPAIEAPAQPDPLATVAPVDGTAVSTDPLATGSAVAPTDTPVVTPAPGTGIPTDAPVVTPPAPATAPAEVAPVASQSADPLAVLNPTVAPPAPAVAPAAPAPTVPVAMPTTTSVGDDLATKVGAAVTDAIRPLQVQVDNIDKRVSRLETGRAPAAAPKAATPRAQSTRPARRPVAAPKRHATPAAAPVNRIEVLDAAPAVAAPSARVAPVAPAPAAAPVSLSQQKVECKVGAILQGRAWVKKGDGSFETYGVGDTLPDGKVISGISPERGIQVGGQSWKCP